MSQSAQGHEEKRRKGQEGTAEEQKRRHSGGAQGRGAKGEERRGGAEARTGRRHKEERGGVMLGEVLRNEHPPSATLHIVPAPAHHDPKFQNLSHW